MAINSRLIFPNFVSRFMCDLILSSKTSENTDSLGAFNFDNGSESLSILL